MRAARLGSEKLPKYVLCGAVRYRVFREAIWVDRIQFGEQTEGWELKNRHCHRNSILISTLCVAVAAKADSLGDSGLSADQDVG